MENEEYHKYLFLRNATNTLSSAEQLEFDELLKDQQTKNDYAEFVKLFAASDISTSFSRLDDPDFWKNHIPHPILEHRRRKRNVLIMKRSLIAAAAIGIILIGWTIFQPAAVPGHLIIAKQPQSIELTLASGEVIDLSRQKGDLSRSGAGIFNDSSTLTYKGNSHSDGMNAVRVPVGMTYQINLNDGSSIWMNSETRLEFPSKFSDGKREVTITGEAYLQIAKNPSIPFFVKLPNATVEVTGTEFNVNTYDTLLTKVALVTGGVNFRTSNRVIKVSPGTQGVYDNRSKNIYTEPFFAKKTLSWRQGIFFFDAVSLSDISPVLWRWFGLRTKVDDPTLMNKRFVGVLNKAEPIEIFLDNLKAISEIEGYFDQDGVLHFK